VLLKALYQYFPEGTEECNKRTAARTESFQSDIRTEDHLNTKQMRVDPSSAL